MGSTFTAAKRDTLLQILRLINKKNGSKINQVPF